MAQRFRLTMVLGIAFLAALIALSIFLVIIQVALSNERSVQERQLLSFTEKSAQEDSLLAEIKNRNATLSGLTRFKEERQLVEEVLDNVASSLPSELSLLSFSYTPATKVLKKDEVVKTPASIAITGQAPTREQLLSFKDALQANPFFQDVIFPPSNWVTPINITFSFQAKIRE